MSSGLYTCTGFLMFGALVLQGGTGLPPVPVQGPGWEPLFNGKDLSAFMVEDGNATYEVEDGIITGHTAFPSPNTFLSTRQVYGDFELVFETKVDDGLNSGVQIRSRSKEATPEDPGKGRYWGPQVEIESSPGQAGYIYGEATGREWLSPEPDSPDPEVNQHSLFKNGEWNHYRVIAKGPHIQTFINGQLVADLIDEAIYETHPRGHIGLQVHSVSEKDHPQSVSWRNLYIRELDAAKEGQEARTFTREICMDVAMDYLVHLPPAYSEGSGTFPLLVFLHGAGQRGEDVEKLKVHGPPKLIAENAFPYPFIVVSPQCPTDSWWDNRFEITALDAFLDDIMSQYRVDPERVYLTGLSMGGFGTFAWAAQSPRRFAAIVPICGGGNPEKADRLAGIPAWVFHGEVDTTVAPEESIKMVKALEAAGGKVKFTLYPGVDHDSWTETYNNPELYTWLLSHQRG